MPTSPPILATKLYIPHARANRVSRTRLTARLCDGLTRLLTLDSAPAGFGKTTFVGEWRASDARRDLPLAWLSLDDDDNDATRSLTYLIAALGTLRPCLGETALALLHTSGPRPSLPQAILTNEESDSDPVRFLIHLPFAGRR